MLELRIGQVFRVWCTFCRPEPKYKLMVVALIEPRPRYFLINSCAAPFQLANPVLAGHQLAISPSDKNEFLHHDSVLDLSELCGGPTASELEDLYEKDPRILKGQLAIRSRRAARHIIEYSELLTSREVKSLLELW
jgi:hypothetical protein